MKRLVLDTNVLISALFWKGASRKLYEYIRAGKFGLNAQEIFPILVDIRRHTHWFM